MESVLSERGIIEHNIRSSLFLSIKHVQMKPIFSVVVTTITQTGILGKTGGRGEQRLPDWSNVAR